ncbi:MAG TPA: hypothetical protein VIM00_04440, partial [Candidatus Acidoferrum sp.]
MKFTRKLGIWASSIALLGVIAIGGVFAKTHASSTTTEAPIFAHLSSNAPMAAPMAGSYAPLLKEALPQVVNIASSRTVKRTTTDDSNPMFDDPFLRQFFGDRAPRSRGQRGPQVPQQEKEQGLGSG